MIRAVVRLVGGLASLIGMYVLAGLIGAAIPANAGWHQAAQGTRIWVIDNGIHTDIVLPRAGLGLALAARLRARDLADPRQAGHSHVAFGWGDRDFYLNTPSWADVSVVRVARAMVGAGATVIHVSHIPEPHAGARAKALLLRPEEYRRLVARVEASFADGAAVRGYGSNDAFYFARGEYSLVHTCNGWTGAALRSAGVKTGVWTPFPFGVMLWL